MTAQRYELVFAAEAEVSRSPHAEECVALHPGEPCPGYPHDDKKE